MGTPANTRNLSLDGLRGLAAIGVVASHFILLYNPVFVMGYIGAPHLIPETILGWIIFAIKPFITVLFSGAFQVMVFFVISGYVLVLPFWENRHSDLLERIVSRYLRLNIPVAVGTIISFGLCYFGLMHNHQAAMMLHSPWFDSFFNANTSNPYNAVRSALYHCIFWGSRAFNPPLWSIHYEFVGGVFILGIYYFAGRIHRWLPLLSVLALYWIEPGDRAYYGCFIFGAALGGMAPLRGRLLSIGFLFAGLLLGSELTDIFMREQVFFFHFFGDPLFPRMIGAFLVVCAVRSGLGLPFFQSRIVQYLGSISYSIYILHFLILASFVSYFHVITPPFPYKVIVAAVIYFVISIGLSHLFWRFIDVPSIKIARGFARGSINFFRRLSKSQRSPIGSP